MVYLFPILFTLLFALYFDIQGAKRGKCLSWYFLFLYLSLLIGLRYMVGGDTYAYMDYFSDLNIYDGDLWNNSGFQPLFILLNVVSKWMYSDFVSFQILHSILLNIVLFHFFAKYTNFRFTALFLCFFVFYINFSVEILRESLAVSAFLVGYKYLEKRSWIKYYSIVIIATQFHLSAIFLIFLPFVHSLKLNIKFLFIMILSLVAYSCLSIVFEFLNQLSKIGDRTAFYKDAFYGSNSVLLFWIIRFLIPISLMVWAKYIMKIRIKFEPLLCLMCILGLGVFYNGMIFLRLSNYILPFYCVFLADTYVYAFKRAIHSNKLVAILSFCMLLFVYNIASFNWPPGYYKNWLPYYSVFSSESINNQFINRKF